MPKPSDFDPIIAARVAAENRGEGPAYPTIRRAIEEIAFDNNCINRFQSKEKADAKAMRALYDAFTGAQLDSVETHLAQFSKEGLDELCAGEHMDFEDYDSAHVAVHLGREQFDLTEKVLNEAFESL